MTIPEIRVVERVEPDKSKHFLFTQGTIELEIFADDVLRSIDQIDKLPIGKWTEFAIQNELPCDPMDRKLLKPPLMGIIQIAWHRQFKGGPSDKLLANQERRVAAYIEDLEHVKLVAASPTQRSARAQTKGTNPTTPKGPAIGPRFRLKDDSMVTWSQYKSQKGLIVAVMIAANATEAGGKVITKEQIVTFLRGKLNTKQPEERVVGFYISEWQRDGIVEKVVDETTPSGEIPAGFEAKEPQPQPGEKPVVAAEPEAAAPAPKKSTPKDKKKK
jgi:hypothetical protein